MGTEDRERKLRSVHAHKESFVVAAPNGKYTLMQRLGRRLTYWYTLPFGESQNQFNAASAEMLSSVHESLSAVEERLASLETQLERRVFSFTQEQRQSLARAQSAWNDNFDLLRGEIDRSLCRIAPESRLSAGESALMRLPQIGTESLYPELHDVQNALTPEEVQGALDALSASYSALLKESLQKGLSASTERPVVLLCRQLQSGDAVSDEVWDLCGMLRRASRHPACIVSLEQAGGESAKQGYVHQVPEDQLADWIKAQNPALMIVCGRTPELLFSSGGVLLHQNCLVRVTGQDPLYGIGAAEMQELLHLCDSGVHRYCTAAKHCADKMEQLGFRRPAVLYPYADAGNRMPVRRPRSFDAAHFTVGAMADAASLPLLCEIVQQNRDLHFVVLMQPQASLPDALRRAANCTLQTLSSDLSAFYAAADCILLPYGDAAQTEACSRMALAGMHSGIPTVCTPAAGIAEMIEKTGLGTVSARADAASLADALHETAAQYAEYRTPQRAELLRQTASGEAFVRLAEQCIAEAAPVNVPTLAEWDGLLMQSGSGLIRGEAAVRAHYQRMDVAENYTEQRFAAYPHSCFDVMERASVRVLLEQALAGKENPLLLDAACGDGRMLECLLPLGRCTAADASPAMLQALRLRVNTANVSLLEMDLLRGTLPEQYDAITCFRLLRHCIYADRRVLWAKFRSILKPDGVLLFDVPNQQFELPQREKTGWAEYAVYSVSWTREAITRELAENGLRAAAIVPVGAGLYPMPAQFRGEPATYTVLAVPAD